MEYYVRGFVLLAAMLCGIVGSWVLVGGLFALLL